MTIDNHSDSSVCKELVVHAGLLCLNPRPNVWRDAMDFPKINQKLESRFRL
jgi:hypothetical protein